MKNYYVKWPQGGWGHRHPIKLIVNPILRKLQFWLDDPYVIGSMTEFIKGQPKFIKFEFLRVKYK